MPLAWLLAYLPVPAGSVSFRRVTAYWVGVSSLRHSASLFCTFRFLPSGACAQLCQHEVATTRAVTKCTARITMRRLIACSLPAKIGSGQRNRHDPAERGYRPSPLLPGEPVVPRAFS